MKNIAVVQTAFLGDLLLSIPLLKWLRRFAPEAKIHLIVRKGLGQLFADLGLADYFYEVDKSKKFKATHRLPQCDLVLCPHKSFTSARQVLRIKSPLKIGYRSFWNGFVFHRRPTWPGALPDALRTLSLLAEVDGDLKSLISEYYKNNYDINQLRPAPEWASMELTDSSKNIIKLHSLRDWTPEKAAIVLAPGSVWATKRWTIEGYAELARHLCDRGYEVVITGSPQEAEMGRQIESQAKVVNLCGRLSLAQTLWIMGEARAVVSNDSGAMHMASAMGTPTVAIFGPTVLRFGYQPWQSKARVLERADLECRPCSPHGTHKCPLGHHNCMKWISAQEVEAAVLELIGS